MHVHYGQLFLVMHSLDSFSGCTNHACILHDSYHNCNCEAAFNLYIIIHSTMQMCLKPLKVRSFENNYFILDRNPSNFGKKNF